ncbi:MIP/aquaporin family protein [Agromyces sp. Leaf222]|uniref:aquaporin n=1 Tax=Agromyces sp. Leaf222 TaxID=1735688 RepID=UPI00070108F6|nr:MIP/aquaporin family protein [Agromyces sp. Leaf222]KQM83622.1 MIP family protein [Agromyces sp. Leaf222]
MTDESPQPSPAPLARRLVAEFLGTGLLVAIVVGSGIAASQLSPEDIGLQLLENSLATTLGLAVLIAVLAPVSGAHFNPVVSLADWWLARRSGGPGFTVRGVAPYVAAQVLGAIAGAVLANAMFDVPTAIATTMRATPSTLLAELVASAGLVLVIFALVRSGNTRIIPAAVGAYIGAAYWFTSSTSFANPAVTIGRIFSDTFAGIAPASVAPFIAAQVVGAVVGVVLVSFLFPVPAAATERDGAKVPAEVAK